MRVDLRGALLIASATVAATFAQPMDQGRGLTGGVQTYTVVGGDTLRTIGARFGVDASTLAADNGLGIGARLGAGRLLLIDNRHVVPAAVGAHVLVVNIPQRMLFVDDGTGPVGIPVAVGQRNWRTPVAAFTIVTAEENPTWDVPASILEEARRAGTRLPASVPPGPNNPLGRFWLGLSIGGVGIHGTNAPASIYGAVTHGCIRLHPDDIAWVFPRVVVGTSGQTIYEPVLLAVTDRDIFLEVHRDVYARAKRDPRTEARALASARGVSHWIDWERADRVLALRHGLARPVARPEFSQTGPFAPQ